MVGGWEMFQSPSQTATWLQARASFTAGGKEPFNPQLSAVTDYVITLPQPPVPGPDPGVLDVWDQGLWDEALWDQPTGVGGDGAEYRVGVDRRHRVLACAGAAGDGGAKRQA